NKVAGPDPWLPLGTLKQESRAVRANTAALRSRPSAGRRRQVGADFAAGRKRSAVNGDLIVVVSTTKSLLKVVAFTAPPVTRIMASAG
ncbi:MAG: hypothetical protein DRH23_12210, partial [Deltaproteobacteria bacterium]